MQVLRLNSSNTNDDLALLSLLSLQKWDCLRWCFSFWGVFLKSLQLLSIPEQETTNSNKFWHLGRLYLTVLILHDETSILNVKMPQSFRTKRGGVFIVLPFRLTFSRIANSKHFNLCRKGLDFGFSILKKQFQSFRSLQLV